MATNPFKQLDVIRKASSNGGQIVDCYKLLQKKDLWIKAYTKLAPNPGNLTEGTDNQTIDGFNLKLIDNLIEEIKKCQFRFSPVRRTHIPKRNGKKRPLGMPNFKDKLVQEAIKMILENIYEPIFSENSHGFRPNRSCHTALSQIKHTWKGTIWCIEGDIEGFFDNIDHSKLISILEKKINDRRFILLIHNALKCGYMEDWKYHKTYSGTPQGGIASPILANIYLNELDSYMENKIEQFNSGKVRRRNKEYNRIRNKIHTKCKQVETNDKKFKSKKWKGRNDLIREIKDLKKAQLKLPSIDLIDPDYKRMKYVRYADDFVIGLISPKTEAKKIKAELKQFLKKNLNLKLSEEKTRITHLENKISFLGYQFYRWNRKKIMRIKYKNYKHPLIKRTLSGAIKLEIPQKKIAEYTRKQKYGCLETLKSTHRGKLMNNSEIEILYTYNTELRGFANFYNIANNYHHLGRLFHTARFSFLKTLAAKNKSTIPKTAGRLKRHVQGELCLLVGNKKGEKNPKAFVQLKHLPKKSGLTRTGHPTIDIISNTRKYSSSTELERRLIANKCEACGRTDGTNGTMEVHHVRKLKDIKKKRNIDYLDKIMIERRRKTLILCYQCHHLHHERQIPINQLESRIQ